MKVHTPLKKRSARAIMEVTKKVEEAYNAGFDDEEALRWAEVTEDELKELLRMNPKIAAARDQKKAPVNLAARVNWTNAIMKDGDVKASMRYLERTDPEFSGKQNITLEGAPVVVPVAEKEAAMRKLMEKYGTDKDFTEDDK